MTVFDEHIAKLNDYVEELARKKVQNRHYYCTGSVDEIIKELPIEVGSGVKPNVILRGDTFMELGNPLEGSCSVFLWTDDPAKIKNGKITLFGPDIMESNSESMPFGQIFLVGGKKLPDLEHNDLVHNHRVYNEIEGFMVKNSPDNNSWCRISRDVAKKGFSFEILGKAQNFSDGDAIC